MSSDREATREQSSSALEGAGYDDVYLSGCELVEDSSWSSEKEPSTYSPTKEEEEYEVDEEEGEEDEEGEGGDKEGHVEGDKAVGQVNNMAFYSPLDTDDKQLLPHYVPKGF